MVGVAVAIVVTIGVVVDVISKLNSSEVTGSGVDSESDDGVGNVVTVVVSSCALGKTLDETETAGDCCWFSLVLRISAARSVRFPLPVASATAETVSPATPSLSAFTVADSASFSGPRADGFTGRRGFAEPSTPCHGSIPLSDMNNDSSRSLTVESSADDDPSPKASNKESVAQIEQGNKKQIQSI